MTPKPATSFDSFLEAFNLKSLRSSDLIPPMTAPTVMELVEQQRAEAAQAPRRDGLFTQLFGGDLDAVARLHGDYLDRPDKYAPEALALFEQLLSGRTTLQSLPAEQQEALDRAALDFASYVPVPPPRATEGAVRPAHPAPAESAAPRPGVDLPEGVPEAYWWLK